MSKLHWYCFTYKGETIESGGQADASTYTGYDEKGFITLDRIKQNKKNAGVKSNSTLTNIIYLGHMTKEEFLTNDT